MTSYDTLRVKVGRRPITVVEIDLDYCSRTYGVSPCTASVPGTGPQKCFNTYGTCQALGAYNKTTKTYKFTEANSFLPVGENVFPCITSVDIAPTQLKPGAFSVSASVTVSLQDFPHHDRGVDPYVSSRSYDPTAQGTFFGKLKGRNPYLVNRVMRVNTGYVDDDRTVYTLTRTYFIDRMEGPDAQGRVKLIGKDLLRFPEIEKTMCPRAATGNLTSASGTSPFSLVLSPSGSGANYGTSGFLAVEDELMEYTARSGDTLTVSGRGSNDTGLSRINHAASTPVQETFPYPSNGKVCLMIYKLLVDYAGIDTAYIDYSDWEAECDTYLAFSNQPEVQVTEPESVKKLIDEILDSYFCSLWWDELDAKIKFKVITTDGTSSLTLNEEQHILESSMTVKVLEKDRISRVQINYATFKKGPSLGGPNYASKFTPNISNTSQGLLLIDTASEGDNQYGGKAEKSIISRWIAYLDYSVAAIAQRYLDVYATAPREVTFKLDAKDSTLRTGDLVNIKSRLLQSADGTMAPIKFLVTQFREVVVGSQYEYTAMELSS